MDIEPFDVELEPDRIVTMDTLTTPSHTEPIMTLEDFRRQLEKLSLSELCLLLAQMKADEPSADPHSLAPRSACNATDDDHRQ
jgi:hypothetical protein